MSPSRARLLAWTLFGIFIAILILGAVLIASGQGHPEDIFFVAVGGYAFVGALVASRQPDNAVGWLLLAIGITLALGALIDTNLLSEDPFAPELTGWLSTWTWYVWLTLAAAILPLVFPDGRLVSRRWRPVLWLGVAGLALGVAAAGFKPGPLETDSDIGPIQNPFGIGGTVGDALSVLGHVDDVLAAISFVLAAVSLVVRFRRSRGVERLQLKWFAYVAFVALAGLAVAMLQVLFGTQPGEDTSGTWFDVVGAVGWFVALGTIVIGIPAATGIAILRHRLYDIDVVINRTLVYGALTATLAASYLGLVLLLQLALGPLTEDNGLAIAGSTLGVAALFRPARERIQEAVDRRFYRRRYDATRTLEGFGARLRDEIDLDALGVELRGVVAETMQPAHVSLWLREAPR